MGRIKIALVCSAIAVVELYRYHPGILIYYSVFRHWDGMDRKWDGMLGFEFFLKPSHFARKPLTFQRSGR
jgi:hypothetical protein